MYYFDRYYENQGSHDFLVNEMFRRSDELEFHLVQICYIILNRKDLDLEKLLIYISSNDFLDYLKICWCLKSYGISLKGEKEKRLICIL